MEHLGAGIVKSQNQNSNAWLKKIQESNFAEKLPNSRQFADVSNLPTFAGFVDGKLVLQAQGNKVETIQEVVHAVANH